MNAGKINIMSDSWAALHVRATANFLSGKDIERATDRFLDVQSSFTIKLFPLGLLKLMLTRFLSIAIAFTLTNRFSIDALHLVPTFRIRHGD